MLLGKNAWQSHGFQRARTILKAINNDPDRTLIVVDPVRNETAALADHHVAVRPGADAFLYAAMLGVLVEEDLVDHAVPGRAHHRRRGAPHRAEAACRSPTSAPGPACPRSRSARWSAASPRPAASPRWRSSASSRSPTRRSTPTSTSCCGSWSGASPSRAAMAVHSTLLDLERVFSGPDTPEVTPVTGSRIVSGMVPCNVIPDEILTDHPKRFRAMVVESDQPGRTPWPTAPGCGKRCRALEFSVVIDVAFTETAALRRLRPAGRVPVREVGVHLLQLRVPPELLPPAGAAVRPAAGDAARAGDPPPRRPGHGLPHRRGAGATAGGARHRRPAGLRRRLLRRSTASASPSTSSASGRWRCTPCSARRCPTARRRPPCCGRCAHRLTMMNADAVRRAGIEGDVPVPRRGAVRGDPDRPVGRRVHRRRLRRHLEVRRQARPPHRRWSSPSSSRSWPGWRRAEPSTRPSTTSSRSSSPPGPGGPSRPTPSSATRTGARATGTARCT